MVVCMLAGPSVLLLDDIDFILCLEDFVLIAVGVIEEVGAGDDLESLLLAVLVLLVVLIVVIEVVIFVLVLVLVRLIELLVKPELLLQDVVVPENDVRAV